MKQQVYRIVFGKRYKKDIKRLKRSNVDLAPLETVIDALAAHETLPTRYKDHELKGASKGIRECHIAPDWLLLYKKDNERLMLLLLRTGTHRSVLGTE